MRVSTPTKGKIHKIKNAVGNILHEHLRKFTITISRYYPDHPPRTESSLYRRTHHKLIVIDKTPCYVCGTMIKRETHHYFVEWADAEAVDWDKIRKYHPNFDWQNFHAPIDFCR